MKAACQRAQVRPKRGERANSVPMKPQRATLLRLQPIDIHGQKFYDVTYALEAKPDAPKTSRLGAESVYEDAKEGDQIEVSALLGQLTGVRKAE